MEITINKYQGDIIKQLIIDVREPFEYLTGHVKDAVNIPLAELMAGAKKLENIAKDTEIVLYCISGSRSNASMHYLRQMGYTNLCNGINKSQVNDKYGL